jgi:nucleoside-diphosphate-sugar epimerase
VVYQALNPPYHRWAQEFPGLQAAAIAAAQAAGARLVVMDNVYMYGRANGRPFTEDRAADAHTRKGRVRAAMARDLMAAHDAGRVQVTVGRASDFFGPRAGEQSLIGDWVIPPALASQAAGTTPRLKVTPAWQMRALGLVNRTVREINEMRYEFDEPFLVDASRGNRARPARHAARRRG